MKLKDWFSLERGGLSSRVRIRGIPVTPGSRVRLRPRAGGDIFDKLLEGKTAAVEAIEKDFDGRTHIAVVVDENPGRDLGELRQPCHRLFFAPEEVEPIVENRRP